MNRNGSELQRRFFYLDTGFRNYLSSEFGWLRYYWILRWSGVSVSPGHPQKGRNQLHCQRGKNSYFGFYWSLLYSSHFVYFSYISNSYRASWIRNKCTYARWSRKHSGRPIGRLVQASTPVSSLALLHSILKFIMFCNRNCSEWRRTPNCLIARLENSNNFWISRRRHSKSIVPLKR